MPSRVAYAAALCAAATGWLVRGSLALQSAAPGAPKIGLLPPWWELILFLLAGACTVFLLRPSTDRMRPLFATAICALPWLPGVRSPVLLMWTGPLGAFAWWGAVAASLLAGSGGVRALSRFHVTVFRPERVGPIFATAAACAFFAIVAFGARHVVPGGDEPHYLIITQSLLEDGDLQIENNHARGDYHAYFAGALHPDFWRRGQNGAIYSVHAPGVPALVAPAFLLGGYEGVVVFLVLVSGIAAGLLWWLTYALTGRAGAAWFAVAATATAAPVAFHSFTVFPDGLAGFIVLTGVWALLRLARVPSIPIGSRRAWMLHGLALALLPWMHARLAALAGMIGVVILLRMARRRVGATLAAAFVAVPIISAAAWFTFFYVIYGTPSPAAPWTRLVTSWSFIPGGLTGLLFDQQFGAVFYAPVLLVAAAGWLMLYRSDRRLAVELAAVAVPYMIVTTRLWIWWGGWSAPARFWTPLFWMGGICAAFAWRAIESRLARYTAIALLLTSALTTLSLAYAFGGRLVYNERDGYARWFDWLSTLTDLPLALPSFFRSIDRPWSFEAQILVFVVSFGLAFLVLRWLDRRLTGNGSFALALLVAYGAAGMVATDVILRMNHADGVRASVAQLRLLEAARDAHQLSLRYDRFAVRFSSVEDTVRALRIESPPRLASPGSPLVLPGWFPAGTYTLFAEIADGPSTAYEVRVLRAGPPILTGAATASNGRIAVTLALPVDTPALILRGGGLASAFLQPAHVASSRERFAAGRATSARRYGRTIAWFTDERAFGDPDGIWVEGGGRQAEFLLQPDSGTWVQVLVRNGPVPNQVTLTTDQGAWSWSATMSKGEEREVRVPVDPARGAVPLRVTSSGSFRPSEIDPSSRDTRLLGVWLSPRFP